MLRILAPLWVSLTGESMPIRLMGDMRWVSMKMLLDFERENHVGVAEAAGVMERVCGRKIDPVALNVHRSLECLGELHRQFDAVRGPR